MNDIVLIKEKIKFYTEMLKVHWAIVVILAGSLANLFFSLNNIFKIIIFTIGLILLISVILVINEFNTRIFNLFEKMEGHK